METGNIYLTGAIALIFSAVFLIGGRFHPFRSVIRDRRSLISFSAGMSAAYVFVRLMPELQGARHEFTSSISAPLRYDGMVIYFFALFGFLVFYGLDHLRARLRGPAENVEFGPSFWLHVGGFAAYTWLVAYLLVHDIDGAQYSTALYAVGIVFHFLTVDHALRNEHGVAYERVGRFVLAGTTALGWGTGFLFSLPVYVLAILVAFLSGAIIMNSSLSELPSDKDGRFFPFLTGGLVYGLILLPLG